MITITNYIMVSGCHTSKDLTHTLSLIQCHAYTIVLLEFYYHYYYHAEDYCTKHVHEVEQE